MLPMSICSQIIFAAPTKCPLASIGSQPTCLYSESLTHRRCAYRVVSGFSLRALNAIGLINPQWLKEKAKTDSYT